MKTFLNFVKISALVFLVLFLLVLIGGFIFLKTFDIKKYKTQIVAAADKALGRHLEFNDIELKASLKEGIQFYVTDATISENPAFGNEPFLKVKEVFLGLDVLSFLNARRVSVPSILIKSPRVTIIQNASGALNVQSIGTASSAQPSPASPASPTPSASPTASASSSTSPAASLPAIFINSLVIENASVRYIDQSVTPPVEAAVSQVDFKVEHFSLDRPFDFALQAAILSQTQNLKVDGRVDLNVPAQEVHLSNVHLGADLGQMALADIKRLPALKGVPFPEVLEGVLNLTLKDGMLSQKGLGAFTLDGQLDSGKVYIKEAAPGIPVDLSNMKLGIKNFSLGQSFGVSFQAAVMNSEPNINLQGTVALDLNTQAVSLKDFVFNTDLSKLPLVKMKAELAPLKDVKLPEVLSGLLSVNIKNLSAGPQGLGDFLLDADLQDGQVSLKEIAPQTNFAATQINLNVKDFSLKGPFVFALKMAYLNPAPDIDVQGTAALDMKAQSVHLQNFTAGVDLGLISLSELKANVGALKGTPLPEVLEGKLSTLIKNLEAGPAGLKSVAMDLKLQNGRVSMKEAAPGISINAKDINMDVQDFGLYKEFGLKLGLAYLSDAPDIQFDGRVSVDPAKQVVGVKDGQLAVDLSKINFGELKSTVASLATVPLPEFMAGDLKVTINEINAGAAGLMGLLADVALENGAVQLKNIAPGVNVEASQIALDVKDVSLDKKPMPIHLKAAYLSDQPNLDFAGTAAFDMAQSSVEIKDSTFKTDLSLWSMEKLKSSVAALKDIPLPTELKGLFNLQIDTLAAGPKGLSALQTHGDLSSAVIKLKELKLPVNISQLKFQTDGVNAKVDDLVVVLGKGTIKAKAAIDQYLIKPILHQEITIDGLDLDEVLEQKDAPVKAQGSVYASMKIDGDPSNLNSLAGNGTFELKDGKLKGLNVIKAVFDSIKIPMLPNLSNMVMSALPEEYKKQFENPDTDLKSVKSTMAIAQGAADLSVIDVESDLFAFNGSGKAGFDQSYAVDGSFNLTKDLSDLLVKDLENPFAYMRNEQSLISFPVHVKGKGAATPKFEVEAIVKDVLKNAAQSKGKEELGRFLDKVLNKNGIQTQSPQTAPEQGDGQIDQSQSDSSKEKQAPQKSTGEQLIDGVFGTIFK